MSWSALVSSNCTFMELKSASRWRPTTRQLVLIVPLWNWNPLPRWTCCWLLAVLIVPLWNWNINTARKTSGIKGSNCTFMELKYAHYWLWSHLIPVLIVPLWNWNRNRQWIALSCAMVLIVPLWNWNKKSNRCQCGRREVLIVPLWNWNLIEYKKMIRDWCSNCTFMELKCGTGRTTVHHQIVLIVPLWNWNPKNRGFTT